MIFAGSGRHQPRQPPSLEVSQVEGGDLAERRHVYFGVDTGRRRTAVSQMITDLLERQASGEEACRTGMAQGVPAPVGRLDSESDKSTIGDIVDAPRLHWPTGGLDAEEDFRAG